MTVVAALEHTTAKHNILTVVWSVMTNSCRHSCRWTSQYACSLVVRSREERREVGRGLRAVRTEDWWDIKQGWDVTDLDVSV